MVASNGLDPQLTTFIEHSAVPPGIREAVHRQAGARFFRCALQVNPYAYLKRHSKSTPFKTEQEYNAAIVAQCLKENVEVVGITDHFRVAESHTLSAALSAAGVHVLLGFEANSSEGVHLLCLFSSSLTPNELERTIGACGVTDLQTDSPQSRESCQYLLSYIPTVGGIVIAAHACGASGLLTTLRGQTRVRAWTSPALLAIALPGARSAAPESCRDIILNKDPIYLRPRTIAVVNANDVSSPEALAEPSSTTWIKMTSPSIEGLRQAFLDWESRIRLNSDPKPGPHTELIAASWAGGLLDGQRFRFNDGLNVLVGGRGAGKSTLIESLRYAFELPPKGDEARRTHDNMIKTVLGQGSSISILIRSPRPSPQYYLIERIYGSAARVRDQTGELLQQVKPSSILGNLEVYGQHEISELTRYPQKLAQLLRRFTEPTADTTATKKGLKEKLERSRGAIESELAEIARVEEALGTMPALKEHLKRFAAAGLDNKLKEKTSIDRESRFFEKAENLIGDASDLAEQILSEEAFERPLVGEDADDLPNAAMLSGLDAVRTKMLKKIHAAGRSIQTAAMEARNEISKIKEQWIPKQKLAESAYQATLKELRTDGHDASKFVAYKDQYERLKPKETELKGRKRSLAQLQSDRRELLAEWDAAKAEDFRELQRAARKVTKRLKDRVRVRVIPSPELDELESVIRQHCSGNISQAIDRLRNRDGLNLTDFGTTISEGASALVTKYGFTRAAAERIAQGGMSLSLAIEECEIPTQALLELNVGSEKAHTWKELDQLSTGQKATAVLLLLLLESDAPLIVDQPEDDLDNRFIAEIVVPTMREEKRKRQFVFSTHNANIPVLGDAEQIAGLRPLVEGGLEHATIPEELSGSIDAVAVKEMVKELLEGGQEAFEFRREKYGF